MPLDLKNRMLRKSHPGREESKISYAPYRLFCLSRIQKSFSFLSPKKKKRCRYVAWACAINVRSTNTRASGVTLELGYK